MLKNKSHLLISLRFVILSLYNGQFIEVLNVLLIKKVIEIIVVENYLYGGSFYKYKEVNTMLN